MAYICYNKLWEFEFDEIVSKKDKVQDLNNNHLKHEVHDSYKKDDKIKTIFELQKNENALNKAYLDENVLKIDGHL